MILDDIKILLNIDLLDSTKDSILNIYIRRAIIIIQNYLNDPITYTSEYIQTNFQDAIIELVVTTYNMNGKSNIKQEQQGTRTTIYTDSATMAMSDTVEKLLPLPRLRMM